MPNSQTVLITGASSGIGAEIARRFAKEGYDLLLFGRDEKRLNEVRSTCKNKNTEVLAFDLKHLPDFSETILQKLAQLSPPAVLVNNAGLFHQGTLEETTDADWTAQFQVNLLSAVQLTKMVWPIFKKNRKGSVLNIASTLGLKPTASTGAYSAVKAALINWTYSLAQEGGEFNIRANCICPGIVDTPIHSFHSMPQGPKDQAIKKMAAFQILGEIGKPEDVAEAAYFMASELSKWTTASVLSVDGGINFK